MNCQKIDLNDYQIVSTLGEGAISRVYLVKHKQTKKSYALKKVNKKIVKAQNILYQIFVEKMLLCNLNSPLITKIYGTCQDEFFLYFLLEIAELGTLEKLMSSQINLNESLVKYIMSQLLLILKFLRSNGIIHRDLKPCNILITKDYKLKVIDLGTSKIISFNQNDIIFKNYLEIKKKYKIKNNDSNIQDQEAVQEFPSFVGTAKYIAPEILKNQQPSFGTDMWSFGIIFYKLMTNKFPFQSVNNYQLFKQIQEQQIKYPENIDQNVQKLISQILVYDQFKRLGNGPKEEGLDFETLSKNHFFSQTQQDKNEIKLFFKNFQNQQNEQNQEEVCKDQNIDKIIIAQGLVKKYKYWFFYDIRQLIIYSDKILEYKNPNTGECKGTINLSNIKTVKKSNNDFLIKTRDRTYYFRSLDQESDYWIQKIYKLNNQYLQ